MTGRSPLLKIIPPLWTLIFLAVALALHFALAPAPISYLAWGWPAAAVSIAGFLLALWGSYLFKKADTEILPTSETNRALVTSGPFAYSRNPMYLGLVLLSLGIALAVGTWPMFLAPAALFLTLNFAFIPFEEEKMARLFGKEYADYRGGVRRWL